MRSRFKRDSESAVSLTGRAIFGALQPTFSFRGFLCFQDVVVWKDESLGSLFHIACLIGFYLDSI